MRLALERSGGAEWIDEWVLRLRVSGRFCPTDGASSAWVTSPVIAKISNASAGYLSVESMRVLIAPSLRDELRSPLG
ncbi:MAG: hypothetical protein AAF827_20115 [Cyanobacteria bacterium P01_D01_bin.6]